MCQQFTSTIHFATAFDLAQRAFCAAAILARPVAPIPRRFVALASKFAGLKMVALLLPDAAVGRPRFAFCWREARCLSQEGLRLLQS